MMTGYTEINVNGGWIENRIVFIYNRIEVIIMDLEKYGKMLSGLRRDKGFTQKQVAEMLGVVPKTVSKWETGHGLPDVETLPKLAKILGVSTETILSGQTENNPKDCGNLSRMKIYVCQNCGAVTEAIGNAKVCCCGKELTALKPQTPDAAHRIDVSEIENDFYITFPHEMTKEHYISFIMYVTYNKVLFVKLYPEQASEVRFPKLFGGKFVYYCTKHGLFSQKSERKRNK